MNGQEYLNQISSNVRPEKKSKFGGFMSSTIFKIIAGAVIALILIIIAGSILSGGKAGLKDQSISLKLNIDKILEVISEYQPNLKSSDLRSNSSSLYTILSNTNRELTAYLEENYSYKAGKEDEKLVEEANTHKDGLSSDLFEAKITGTLDKIYSHKMAFEISSITNRETSIYNATGDEALKNIVITSYNSLNTLYDKFNNFSEAK